MSMPYFALYPVDFLADVGHLGNTELGIYWRLLLVYYRDGKPLPCDTDRLRRIAMTFSPEENRCLDAVVSEFFTMSTEPDGTRVWRNRRADHEIERALSIYANKVGGAKKAREARAARMAAGGVVGAGANELPPPEQAGGGVSDVSSDVRPTSTGESEPEPDSTKSGEDKAPPAPQGPRPPAGFHDAFKTLLEEGVEPGHAADWLKVRAKKSAPLTATAWAAIKREVEKAGITVAEAIKKSAEKGWRGFEAEWWFREQSRGNGTFRTPVGSTAGMDYKEGYGPNGEIL